MRESRPMSNIRDPRTIRFLNLSSDAARSIDEMCDCFEHQLYTRTGSRIEDLLTGFHEPERSILLQELLLLEIEHCIDGGEKPKREPYFNRFPGHVLIIQDVLNQLCPESAAIGAPS